MIANRRSVVVTFLEKIAIFDAFTLEDRLTVTTCYISPGIYSNPIAVGTKWMAYAEKKLIPSRRSSGGNEGEGVQVRFHNKYSVHSKIVIDCRVTQQRFFMLLNHSEED